MSSTTNLITQVHLNLGVRMSGHLFHFVVASCPAVILNNSKGLSGKEIVQSSTGHTISRFCDLNSSWTK